MTSANDAASSCPYMSTKAATANQKWWPNQLNLKILNQRGTNNPDPSFNYAQEFLTLDLPQVKKDIAQILTTSQSFWPADYGNYGPFMIRMAWHSAGTYRITDGRGGANTGNLRFAPLNSWPDNANLDKAKRLLWPVKQKYGRKISWADLMILTGNVALESMGFETFGFAGGREDIFTPEDDVYWGPEETWLADQRYPNKLDRTSLEKPLGAVQMGLIYVNPEGPNGNPDPLLAAKDIRETFARMAMNDEETVALIAGGHTFGKCHGAGNTQNVGQEPEGAPIEYQGLGWISSYKSGKGQDAITSGLEGAWTAQPNKWDYGYFDNLFRFDWVKTNSPAGATQWIPSDASAQKLVPDAHDKSKRHPPIMLTTDLALRFDPIYGPISHKFLKNPQDFAQAFAKAWFKLTHRDMGPLSRYLGPEVPKEVLLWQDPIPAPSPHSRSLTVLDLQVLKSRILASGLTISQLTRAAWASACTYRRTDHRGGANGGRVRLAPQIHWPVNKPFELQKVLLALDRVKQDFGKEISMADLIILGGCAAIEAAAKKAGRGLEVPFAPGRTDASLQQTDVESFTYLEPTSDGFRNYLGFQNTRPAEELLVDRAQLLGLTAPEMTVLVGGMRVLDTSHEPGMGVLTREPGKLDNAFFINLLDMNTVWKPTRDINVFEGYDYDSHHLRWKASRVDLIFGSNSELRAIAEYYACDDCRQTFVDDFVKAWSKVMNADRFDLKATAPGRAKL